MPTIIKNGVTPPTLPAIEIEIESPCCKSEVQALSIIKCPNDTGKDGTAVNGFHPTLTAELLLKPEKQDQDDNLYKSEPVAGKSIDMPTAALLPFNPIAGSPCQEAEVKTTKITPDLLEEDEKKLSVWARFREGLAHDPLNDAEFVEAYNDWKKRNRKERYERRRAWIRAHGSRLGRLVRLVDKKKSHEAWAAYQEKLAYMED